LDSLTHIVVGAAIGTAVLGRKAGPRAALWGAVASSLPDLDVLIPHGNPVQDFTLHRAATHSLFWLSLAAPVLAWLIARIEHRQRAPFRAWLLLAWLALVAHPLLDAFTVYGTQLLLPFSDYPVAVGSVFIIDPLYTLPIAVATGLALYLLRRAPSRALRWNAAGLVAGTVYLAWTVTAQLHVTRVVDHTLDSTSPADRRVLVTPTPFNSLLWRVVVMTPGGYDEGFYSLLPGAGPLALAHHRSEDQAIATLRGDETVRRLEWFTHGFYAVSEAPPDAPLALGSASTLAQMLGRVPTTAVAAGVTSWSSPTSGWGRRRGSCFDSW
jgi:inner membrane protein